jgi:hypothetical protein
VTVHTYIHTYIHTLAEMCSGGGPNQHRKVLGVISGPALKRETQSQTPTTVIGTTAEIRNISYGNGVVNLVTLGRYIHGLFICVCV